MERAMLLPIILALGLGAGLGGILGYYGKCTSGACPLTANPKRGALYGMVLAGLFVVPNLMARSSQRSEVAPAADSAVIHIDSAQGFQQQVLQADKPVLVDFFSPTCPPCRLLSPTIEELAQSFQGRAVVAKVNVDDIPSLAEQYNISAIPAVLLFYHGQEAQRIIGYNQQSVYVKALDKLLS